MGSFNPKNQTFLIAGPDGVVNISISFAVIDAQRVRLASVCISYGVQLGLCLATLIMLPLLTPMPKMRKSVYIIHVSSLVISIIRLSLLVMYFPGPLSEYYVAWTRDPTALKIADYDTNTAANAFGAILFALIEASLIRQSWGLIKTWPDVWQWLIKGTSISLAVATITLKSLWVVHHTNALRNSTLPVPLDNVGDAATVLGAASIFYFCGIFFSNLVVHMMITRGILTRPGPGLTSLEILAIGNGTLMVLPCIFAGLDVAAGVGGNRVLPFDAGSWVMTLVVIGLPIIGLIATHRGPASRQQSQRFSLFMNGAGNDTKPRASQVEGTTLGSPIARSFAASGEAGRKGSTRSQEQGSARPWPGERELDLELGIQIRRDISVTVEDSSESSDHLHIRDAI